MTHAWSDAPQSLKGVCPDNSIALKISLVKNAFNTSNLPSILAQPASCVQEHLRGPRDRQNLLTQGLSYTKVFTNSCNLSCVLLLQHGNVEKPQVNNY